MEQNNYWFPSEGKIETYTTGGELSPKVLYDPILKAMFHEPAFPEFQAFRKIPRLFRDVVISEKIDGTNASITITEDGQIKAGKRTSYCTPEKDNYGFATWVEANKTELLKLGKGRHFGEWYGKGINRNYGLQERRFALFNVSIDRSNLPNCVGFVPVLFSGTFDTGVVKDCLRRLAESGSVAVPGFLKPEGIVLFHVASGSLYKATIEHDEKPKGVTE